MGGERRRSGGELQLHGFSVPKIVEPRSVPDAELYRDREFVENFFAEDAVI
jgi:hypothetical protein